jgi:Icc-related predicted phosphoesterase
MVRQGLQRRVELYRRAKMLAYDLRIKAPNYRYASIDSLNRFINENTNQEFIEFIYDGTRTDIRNGDDLYNRVNPRMIANTTYHISNKYSERVYTQKDGFKLRPEIEGVELHTDKNGNIYYNKHSTLTNFKVVRQIRKDQPKRDWYKLYMAISEIFDEPDEYGIEGDDFRVHLLFHVDVDINPLLLNMRDGEMNCACKIVLDAVKSLKEDKNTKTIIKHIEDINNEYFKTGIDNVGLQKLADKTRYDLVVFDKSKNVWATFNCKHKNSKQLMILAHNKHLSMTTDLRNPINNMFDGLKLNEIKCRWVDTPNQVDAYAQEFENANIEGKSIYSRGILVGYITANLIVKMKFPECEKYPECFTEGSVGKSKFLEKHEQFKYGMNASNPFYKLILDADVSGFYMRMKDSKLTNIKYDMNKSYKSFRSSGLFNGFPNITGIFNVDNMYSEFSTNQTNNTIYGLVYIEYDYNKLSLDDFKDYKQIYYEGSGWYPIEIVKHNYDTYGINPLIKQYMYASDTWDTSIFDDMSNQQFRSFIGKCVSQSFSESWETSDYLEFMRARYILKDRIINISKRHIDSNGLENKKYIIEYKSDKTPWNFPIISVYVKAHQKFNLFNQINKLHTNGIKIISVSVDSIETKKPCDNLFDLGINFGQWKKEELFIRPSANFIIERTKPNLYNSECLNWTDFTNIINLFSNRFIHISGAGGNGKSELICSMGKSFLRGLYTATTNEAVKNLSDRLKTLKLNNKAETMHKVFSLNCSNDYAKFPLYDYDIIYIDECSMISNEQLIDIMKKVRPNQKLIISGDFYQLPCVNGTQIYDVETKAKTTEYNKFAMLELTKNYRQALDSEFFELCNKIRNHLTIEEAQTIIDKLNTRVKTIDTADYSSINSIYIAGRNKNVDAINEKFTFTVGTKVICNTATYCICREYIPNNQIGIIVDITNDRFKLQWSNGSQNIFKIAQKNKFSIGMCNTVHKAQGKTMINNVVINPNSLFEKHHLYVALTRATKFDSIILTEPITMRIFKMTCYVF